MAKKQMIETKNLFIKHKGIKKKQQHYKLIKIN